MAEQKFVKYNFQVFNKNIFNIPKTHTSIEIAQHFVKIKMEGSQARSYFNW